MLLCGREEGRLLVVVLDDPPVAAAVDEAATAARAPLAAEVALLLGGAVFSYAAANAEEEGGEKEGGEGTPGETHCVLANAGGHAIASERVTAFDNPRGHERSSQSLEEDSQQTGESGEVGTETREQGEDAEQEGDDGEEQSDEVEDPCESAHVVIVVGADEGSRHTSHGAEVPGDIEWQSSSCRVAVGVQSVRNTADGEVCPSRRVADVAITARDAGCVGLQEVDLIQRAVV